MARRKRASMREGPLADLFRSTVDPEDPPEAPERAGRQPEEETSVMREQPARPQAREPEPERGHPAEPAPFDHSQAEPAPPPAPPEEVQAYHTPEPPAAKERLSRIFGDDVLDADPPAYGRDEPTYRGDF